MLKIIKNGLQTSIQDLGRIGFQKYGVIASGAMDTYSHRVANLLVGNKENEATIEITLIGPVIHFEEDAFIALCGGDLSPAINGQPIHMWQTTAVPKDSVLSFGAPRSGCRAYLAIAGGIDVPHIMGSKSTYLRAAIGGFQGRTLQAGDFIKAGPISRERSSSLLEAIISKPVWRIQAPSYFDEPVVHMMPGRQFELFDDNSKKRIFTESFVVSSHSDRMGYRLEGSPLALAEPKELISEAVAFGSIQVPSDGNPIVLLADRQTTGGYPKIGQVASADLPLIAQLKAGDRIRFKEISLEEAQRLYLEQEQQIRQLTIGINLKREEYR